jgi:hypothetical protein
LKPKRKLTWIRWPGDGADAGQSDRSGKLADIEYLRRHGQVPYPIGPANPIEAIKFRMEQQGPTPRDLEAFIGPSGRVSEVLTGKRPLRGCENIPLPRRKTGVALL